MSGYDLGRLTELVACPECHSKLVLVGETGDNLVCSGAECRLSFPIREGIPVLLIDEAEALEDSEWKTAVGDSLPEAESGREDES